MDRLSYGTVAVLPVDVGRRPPPPEPASEADVLATAIERAVQRETSRGVRTSAWKSAVTRSCSPAVAAPITPSRRPNTPRWASAARVRS